VLDSLYFSSYAKQNSTYVIISGTTELASVQLALKRLGVCWRELISCHSQRPVCSLTFVLMWTRVENPASKTGVDIRI